MNRRDLTKWIAPVVLTVVIPAHAETSEDYTIEIPSATQPAIPSSTYQINTMPSE